MDRHCRRRILPRGFLLRGFSDACLRAAPRAVTGRHPKTLNVSSLCPCAAPARRFAVSCRSLHARRPIVYAPVRALIVPPWLGRDMLRFGRLLHYGGEMRRRSLMVLLGGALSWPLVARAQQKAMPVIGWLSSASPGQIDVYLAAFRQGLAETGYVEGQNVSIEYRWAENHYDRLPGLAAQLVGREVDVIATNGGEPSAFAAKKATSTIPIVSVVGQDPVATGLVASFARPSGNLTGFTILNEELIAKRLELFCVLLPRAKVIVLFFTTRRPCP